MKIKMKNTAAGPGGTFQAGQELIVGVDVPNMQAQAFLDGGYAVVMEQDAAAAPEKPLPVVKPVESEAVQPAAEKAVKTSPAKKVAKKK